MKQFEGKMLHDREEKSGSTRPKNRLTDVQLSSNSCVLFV